MYIHWNAEQKLQAKEAAQLYEVFCEVHTIPTKHRGTTALLNIAETELGKDGWPRTHITYQPIPGTQIHITTASGISSISGNSEFSKYSAQENKERFIRKLNKKGLEHLITNHPNSSVPSVSVAQPLAAQDQPSDQPAP